jgi:hypothetical protein
LKCKYREIRGSVSNITSELSPASLNSLALKNFLVIKLKNPLAEILFDSPQKQSKILVKDVFPLLLRQQLQLNSLPIRIRHSQKPKPSTLIFQCALLSPIIYLSF